MLRNLGLELSAHLGRTNCTSQLSRPPDRNKRRTWMTRRRQMRKVSAILAAAGVLPLTSATVAQALPVTHASETFKHCISVITSREYGSKTLYHGCTSSQALSERQAARVLGPRHRSPVELITFYQNLSFSGASSTIYGASACNSSGYSFSNLAQINGATGVHGITSYIVHNHCTETRYWNKEFFSGAESSVHSGNVKWVGKTWNDSVLSMRTWS